MNCEIVKDLIPMCIDNTASEEAIKEVEKHTELCGDCRRFYNFCKNSQNRLSSESRDKSAQPEKRKAHDIDAAFADLSKKIKARKDRGFAISMVLLFAAATYAVIDILRAVKRRKNK